MFQAFTVVISLLIFGDAFVAIAGRHSGRRSGPCPARRELLYSRKAGQRNFTPVRRDRALRTDAVRSSCGWSCREYRDHRIRMVVDCSGDHLWQRDHAYCDWSRPSVPAARHRYPGASPHDRGSHLTFELILAHPLFGLALTVAVYCFANQIYIANGCPAVLHPVLTSVIVVALIVFASGIGYGRYFAQAAPLHHALGTPGRAAGRAARTSVRVNPRRTLSIGGCSHHRLADRP